jgi:prepilin-type N-terminal cleavage/methylation domain-containing protein/prepilin-type processing-associated H-X9-DG protein
MMTMTHSYFSFSDTDQSRSAGRRGFTLIELLVVISIISLLMSIMIPSLGQAREQAKRTVCQTHLHSLGQAITNYLTEFDNTFPVNGVIFPKGNPPVPTGTSFPGELKTSDYWKPEYGATWREMSGTQYGVANANIYKAYLCPSDPLDRVASQLVMNPSGTVDKASLLGGTGYFSYSTNSVLNSMGRFRNNFGSGMFHVPQPWGDPLKATSIVATSQFFLLLEESTESGLGMDDECIEPPAWQPANNKLTSRHSGKGNALFGDYHVETINARDFNNTTAVGDLITGMAMPYTKNFFPDNGRFAEN